MSTGSSEDLQKEVERALNSGAGPGVGRFALAILSGVIPGFGGVAAGVAGAWSEQEQARNNRIFTTWLKLQEDEIKEIGKTILEIMVRLDLNDPRIQARVESSEYMALLKKSFRDWSAAESEVKRLLIRDLLANAAATQVSTDDVVRMFIEWINRYSEPHFAILRLVYKEPGITRYEMWESLKGEQVREDSAEADLFKLLIDDLSTGHVIRQHRDKDANGNFVRSLRRGPRRTPSRTMKSAFDSEKEYELTDLGRQFVSYAMNEMVPRIAESSAVPPSEPVPNESAASVSPTP